MLQGELANTCVIMKTSQTVFREKDEEMSLIKRVSIKEAGHGKMSHSENKCGNDEGEYVGRR